MGDPGKIAAEGQVPDFLFLPFGGQEVAVVALGLGFLVWAWYVEQTRVLEILFAASDLDYLALSCESVRAFDEHRQLLTQCETFGFAP